ncbi:MAG: hypothetical protein KDH09_00215, partial [Chrysiogenetes bacterium]|nr:hypothetical protein [Chrysiogenetes bacterium]
MMRFSNLRNAVLAFMLAFTAACSTGGDTAPAGPGSENTTGDASVAACCTVNPSNALAVDTTTLSTVLVPYNAGTGTVSFDGSLSTQIGTTSSLTDVSRIMILLDENPNAGVSYEYVVADSGHMFDPANTDLTSDPDNSDLATDSFTVTNFATNDVHALAAAPAPAGSLVVTVTDSATGALLIYCDSVNAPTWTCVESDGTGAPVPTLAVAGANATLTYNDGSGVVTAGDIVTATYRDGTGAGDALGSSGNNGISISGIRTFRGDVSSSGDTDGGGTGDANNCGMRPGADVDEANLTAGLPGLDAAILLDDGVAASAATLAAATWGVNAGGILAPCSGIVIRSGGASGRSWSTASPIPVGTSTTAAFKVVFL